MNITQLDQIVCNAACANLNCPIAWENEQHIAIDLNSVVIEDLSNNCELYEPIDNLDPEEELQF